MTKSPIRSSPAARATGECCATSRSPARAASESHSRCGLLRVRGNRAPATTPGSGGSSRSARTTRVACCEAMDITEEIKGGALTVAGEFDDTTPAHKLSGTLEISDFRVIHAPALGKLLQAVTLYGLVDALGGPGLRFSRLTAPFQFYDDMLMLHDARAFSPSLGLTVKGRIDRADGRLDLEGYPGPRLRLQFDPGPDSADRRIVQRRERRRVVRDELFVKRTD